MTNTKTIAVANQKSGAEKSATVFNLGAGLDMDSKFVLLTDVDFKGALTKTLAQCRSLVPAYPWQCHERHHPIQPTVWPMTRRIFSAVHDASYCA